MIVQSGSANHAFGCHGFFAVGAHATVRKREPFVTAVIAEMRRDVAWRELEQEALDRQQSATMVTDLGALG